MKTDQFDDAFRRKLQGLPADTDSGEVDRVHSYVRANKPALPGAGWGKLVLYGGSTLVLIGSLVYNVIQQYRNTHLQASLDSLTRSSVGPVSPPGGIRHDTIYITRSDRTKTPSVSAPSATPTDSGADAGYPSVGDAATIDRQPADGITSERPAIIRLSPAYRPAPAGKAVVSPRSIARAERPVTNPTSLPVTAGRAEPTESAQTTAKRTKSVDSLASTGRSDAESDRSATTNRPATDPISTETGAVGEWVSRPSVVTRSKNRRNNVPKSKADHERADVWVSDWLSRRTKNAGQRDDTSPPVDATNGGVAQVASEPDRLSIAALPVAPRQFVLTLSPLIVRVLGRALVRPEGIAAATKPTRRAWHLTMPHLAVPNAQYRIGGVLSGGPDQVSGGVLGEIQLTRHWSVQGGLQLSKIDGFHYRDENEFDKRHNRDFRQTYGVSGTTTADIDDIQLTSMLVQVPLQVAYHYPLGRQWGMQLGLGTELDLAIRSTIGYGYHDNNRTSERTQSVPDESVTFLNNATLNLALERSWKRWHFRAGGFIGPQLREVSYKPEDLTWGARLQVFYRLGN